MTTPDPGQKHERLRQHDVLVLQDSLPTPIEVEYEELHEDVIVLRIRAPREIRISVRRAGEAS